MRPHAAIPSVGAMRSPEAPTRTATATPHQSSDSRIEWVALTDVAPIALGLIPFAVVIGITMARLGIPRAVGVVGSALVFAGSAQLAALTLLASGAGVIPMLLSVLLINARLAIYGGALEPLFRRQPRWFRWLGPHFLVDQNYGLVSARRDLAPPQRFRRYWLTTSLAIGAVWLTTISLAMTFAESLPQHSPISFAATCIYVALLVPKLDTRPGRAAAATAASTALVLGGVAHGAGVIAGVGAGVAVAALMTGPRS
jgi:predicted branched-subunit amino acid permease